MMLSKTVAEDIASIERQTGHKISDKAVSLIKAVAAKADHFAELGRQHAAEGCQLWTAEDFAQWGRAQFGSDSRGSIFATLMYECYSDEYTAVTEVSA